MASCEGGGSVPTYVLGTFYIRFFCTRATISVFIVKPTVCTRYSHRKEGLTCGVIRRPGREKSALLPTTGAGGRAAGAAASPRGGVGGGVAGRVGIEDYDGVGR